DAGDHLDVGPVEDGDGEIGGRAAEHVREQDDAVALVDLLDAVEDLASSHFHVVLGADADSGDALLRPDHMLERGDEPGRQTTVGDENHCDHRISLFKRHSHESSVESPAVSRCRMLMVRPWVESQAASRSATKTERCRPPVQPMAMVT